jgi:ABC-type antimicrobial peptide transport system permease subunit
MVLAAIGIYGVMSFTVAQQTREIGIRIALGASPRRMLGRVLRQGLRCTIAGIALGIAGFVQPTGSHFDRAGDPGAAARPVD